jgi:hypothetical protein
MILEIDQLKAGKFPVLYSPQTIFDSVCLYLQEANLANGTGAQ